MRIFYDNGSAGRAPIGSWTPRPLRWMRTNVRVSVVPLDESLRDSNARQSFVMVLGRVSLYVQVYFIRID